MQNARTNVHLHALVRSEWSLVPARTPERVVRLLRRRVEICYQAPSGRHEYVLSISWCCRHYECEPNKASKVAPTRQSHSRTDSSARA